jgi:hypothetical protein
MASVTWEQNRDVTALTTELNSLANNAAAISSAIDNDTDLDVYADFELVVTYGSNPTDQSLVELYVVRTVDGTNYEDASTTGPVVPRTGYVGGFSLRAVTTAQRIVIPEVRLPPRDFKVFVINKSGQTTAASGNTVKLKTYRQQVA